MGDASMRSPKDFKTSRSGRILFPRLKGWTGERIVIKKGGGVDLIDGGPDCTSTFESERSLFRARNGVTMSQTLNVPTTLSQAQRIKISRSLSQSPSTEASQQRAFKRSKLKENQPVNKHTSSMKETKRSPSPKKKLTKKSSQESLELSPPVKLLRTRVPVSTSADPSKPREKLPKKTSANPTRKTPRERGVKSLSPTTVNNRPSRSLVRNSTTYVKPGPKCSKPRLPSESSSSRERPNPSGKQKIKRGSPTRSRRQRKNASPTPQDVDIYGPEFQPVVVLKRLRIKSEAALKMSTKTKKNNNTARNNKRKSPVLANKVVKKKKKVTTIKPITSTARGRFRTVKETQAIMEATSKTAAADVVEDEAEATAAFFKKDHAAFKRLTEATDILHDDYGESDDNLSIRTMRESSPMPSAVSPIGSLYGDSDADENADDRLLGGSPTLKDRTSFQKAQLVHRVVKDRAKLMQQQTKKQKKRQMDGDEEIVQLPSGSNITPRVGELFQPQRMRALEKNLKAKVGTRGFDFDTIYNGNLIHISVNSDSESEESSIDSLAD